MLTHIDLNSDMGEEDQPDGLAIDKAMMPFITSVNIACGGHAGSPSLMRRTARLASRYGLAIGAHPGFPSKAQFGRSPEERAPEEIEHLVAEQIKVLTDVLEQERLCLSHVKPHGALYNMAAFDEEIALAIVQAIGRTDRTLLLYVLAGSTFARVAQGAGLTVVQEAFCDRAYRSDGSLVPRSEPGALLTSEEAVRRQLHQLLEGSVTSIEGVQLPMNADSLSLHSDTPKAVALAKMIQQEITNAGIVLIAPGQRYA